MPYVYYTAAGQTPARELQTFCEGVRASSLPGGSALREQPTSWRDALKLPATSLPEDAPSVVVIDELP